MSTPAAGSDKRIGQALFVPDDEQAFEHAVVIPDDDPSETISSLSYPCPSNTPDAAARVASLVALGWEPCLETDPTARARTAAERAR